MRIPIATLALIVAGFGSIAANAAELTVQARFTDRQRELIVSYSNQHSATSVEQHGGKGHKGKSKDKGLPPGIAMNLERGKALPPGIAKRHLPPDLVLPPPPKGHEIVVVDGRVLLVEVATQIIRDRLEDVILR